MEFSIDKISFKIAPEEVQAIATMNNNGVEYVRNIDNQLGILNRVLNELARKQMEVIKRQQRVMKYRRDKAEKQPETDTQPETEPQPKPEQ